jgi:hypothetical protein
VGGQVPPASDNELARSVTPGLAVRGGVAFIASATESVVLEVPLASGRATRHPLDPAAWGAPGEGSQREIAAIGPRLLAVSGVDIAADGGIRPIGLRLLDPQTWRTHVVDRDSSGFTALPGGGLGTLANASPPRGLLLTDRSGQRAHTVLRRHVLVQVQYAGRYAYAVSTHPHHRTWVIDVRSGHILRTLPTAQPGIVLP